MYQIIDNKVAITVNDWVEAGLTRDQFEHDSKKEYLSIIRRGKYGNTLIDIESIKRPDRLQVIEECYGKISDLKNEKSIYSVEIDTKAREFYAGCEGLSTSKVLEYTHRASIFNALRDGMLRQQAARANGTRKLKKKEFLDAMLSWHREKSEEMGVNGYSNVRSFERAFNRYLKEGYKSLLHGGLGNDQSRKVSVRTKNLLLSIWRNNDKPFVDNVHSLYMSFIYGKQELFDKETGEIYNPEEFTYIDKHGNKKPLEISVSTVWNYLKDVVNETAIYMDRNGNFDYLNKKRPKHHRRLGYYSLSKISMDDAVLSRKSVRGWVGKYLAVDVVSGYWFRPSYVVGKVSTENVYEAFRNMFCELEELGLPTPGELEVEYFLLQHLGWLNEVFPFVRFCKSPTEKRAEHKIKALKYGTAKDAGHTRGRWYAKHEAYRSVRNKIEGDYIEPVYQPQTIVADDLSDVEAHNNELHPLQKTYPGMTRKDVFVSQINPDLRTLEKRILYKYIGNETRTSIYNNDYCPVNNEEFELENFDSLDRLKPNCVEVTAYWLPNSTGAVLEVYLYQEETYIGKAVHRGATSYNENRIEQTEDDELNKLHQQKRIAKFDKKIKERRASIPKTGKMSTTERKLIENIEVEIVETVQPEGYEETEIDYIALAVKQL
jgi:hypothetical protein